MSSKKSNANVVGALQLVLADTYVLMVKTHSCHWNVEGEQFVALHDIFGTQYNELFTAADELAERLRSLGTYAPAGMAALLKESSIKDNPEKPQTWQKMVADLIKAHETISDRIVACREVADAAEDDVTEDLMIGRHAVHSKTLWMLKSLLK
ncbi:MAG: DNA starvation/stationary phase protection protein [Alphaproteobacteria bacterium]|nr:DNA starvation/stationary phase protection protein [Alphaproteobacteria bacterium]NDC56896.1 DNA starvation/stationary phase protection protein [Alphaproteobacteria bacterium]NDG03780.1 DNA starvation/stationary phase protection protein [Alphaproteobacteria bacterium]